MKLTPISRTTLGEQVASQLAGMISARKWKPGDKLPSELELRKTLHIGRSTLREALRSLSFVGLVVIKPGDGTYVNHGPSKPLREVLSHGALQTREDVDALFETRVVLETELAALAAQRASEEALHKLEALVVEMEKSKDDPNADFASLDIQFHLTIADGSGNRILGRLFHSIHGLIQEIMTKREYILGGHDETCLSHHKVLQALKHRNAQAARAAMHEHLGGFSANYLRQYLAESLPQGKAPASKKVKQQPDASTNSDPSSEFLVAAMPSKGVS